MPFSLELEKITMKYKTMYEVLTKAPKLTWKLYFINDEQKI